MKSVFLENFRINFFYLVKNNLNSFITGLSIILFVAILFFIISNFSPVLYNGNLSLFEKGISIILLLSFIYSGLHCVGYMDHLIKSLTIYDDILMKKIKVTMDGKAPSVAIIIPTLNEDPDMVKETILRAKNVDYENLAINNNNRAWIMGSYRFGIGEILDISPKVLIDATELKYNSLSSALIVAYKKKFWTGASYNTNNYYGFMAGFDIMNMIRIGCSFERSSSVLQKYSNGNWEFVLALLIK